MSDWKIPSMEEIAKYFLTPTPPASATPDAARGPEISHPERKNRPFAERLTREAGRDTLRGHRIEVSCPGGKVSVIDRSRTGGGSREHHASVEFMDYQAGADVSGKVSGETVRIRIDRIRAVFPKDVTITYNVAKDMASAYGIGKTLKEHEEAHVATGMALRTPSFVEDLFRGRLSYTSAATGETVRFAGLAFPSEFVSSVGSFTKGRPMQKALDDTATRIADQIGDAAIAYLRDVTDYIDMAENHGPPLPPNAEITVYRIVGDKLAMKRPPEPKKIAIMI